ncbi:MAG: phosphopyruvate hydratase [Limisphaerales bacterium]
MELAFLKAREILDSRGNPTLEVIGGTTEGVVASASVPSGASTGTYEALELRDKDSKRYRGMGAKKAIENVERQIAPAFLKSQPDIFNQGSVDGFLCELDGTENKSKLGANAILGVSIACARLAARSLMQPLYQYLGGVYASLLPVPMMNILNGGRHADSNVDLQEFMVAPAGAPNFKEALRVGSEVLWGLKAVLKEKGLSTGVGDEGGFAPNLHSNREALDLISEAVKKAGFNLGEDVLFALDPAASEFFDAGKSRYVLKGEKKELSPEEMVAYYADLCKSYPIYSIEDGMAEDDWDGWKLLTERLGKKVQLVGDDIFVTNLKRLSLGIQRQVANAILIKPNQIGTLSETFQAVQAGREAGYASVISHRSGETADNYIADLAVAWQTGQIKTGAPCRGERVSKYNRLLAIEEELKSQARWAGPKILENYRSKNV